MHGSRILAYFTVLRQKAVVEELLQRFLTRRDFESVGADGPSTDQVAKGRGFRWIYRGILIAAQVKEDDVIVCDTEVCVLGQ